MQAFSISAILMLLIIGGSSASPAQRVASSVCFVAERIQIHNTQKSMWWSHDQSRPIITHRPRSQRFNHEWLIFNINLKFHTSSTMLIEIAHRIPDTQLCRFLLHSQESSRSIRLSRPVSCRPGHFGGFGLFSYGYEFLTDRQWIMTGSNYILEASDSLLGVYGRSVRTTSFRDRHMAFWNIKINKQKQCF